MTDRATGVVDKIHCRALWSLAMSRQRTSITDTMATDTTGILSRLRSRLLLPVAASAVGVAETAASRTLPISSPTEN